MRRRYGSGLFTLCAALFGSAFLAARAVEPSQATPVLPKPPEIPEFAKRVPAIKSGDPIFTFNGKNFDGWYTFLRNHKHEDPDHVFSINAEGQLVISGQEFGGITTKNSYGN